MDEPMRALPERLLPWFEKNARVLPWRENRDPYRVWLSEIMLQQTRVEAVREKYLRFLEALPTVTDLAESDEDGLMKLWEGLGYYSRARSLRKAAKLVAEAGAFPRTYEGWLALPGVGEYTAGAVCSICLDLPRAAVDGNVLRVCSRYLADDRPWNDPRMKKEYKARLEAVYPSGRCGDFTQALMELGATVCLPGGAPECARCPLKDLCEAHKRGEETAFPVKNEKKPRRVEKKTVFLLYCGQALALEKRPDRGLLAGLWQLPNAAGTLSPQQAAEQASAWGTEPVELTAQLQKSHIFTHIRWDMTGYVFRCARMDGRFVWADEEKRRAEHALPTAFRKFLEEREALD